MSIRHHLIASRFPFGFLLCCFVFISCFPGCVLMQKVTLDSIQILTTHEWFNSAPTVYFRCKEENKTVLPDVKETNVSYSFKGEESWQPLTVLQGAKCKRCGFYEQDTIKSDDVFDEWELCPSDFTTDGKYTHYKEKELSATFLCQGCLQSSAASGTGSGPQNKEKGMQLGLLVVIVLVVSTVVILGVLAGYKYWQKRKRQHEQARFLKLFEDDDEIEDELGLGNAL